MIRTFSSIVTAVGALLLFTGCDVGSIGPRDSTVSIQLTDAPGDLKEAWVEITEIYLAGEEGSDRVVLHEGSTGLIDLLTLSGGKTLALVEGVAVPAGTYSQLRFVVGSAYIVTEAGDVYATSGANAAEIPPSDGSLQCPSCGESGLKVNLPGGAVTLEDESTVLVVDFDVSQSFGAAAGSSGNWVMRPVMHASEFSTSGTISGTVAAADPLVMPESCGGTAVDLTSFIPTAALGETVRSGATESTGAYKIAFVAPGDYALDVAPVGFENGDSLFFTAAATPATVAVAAGKTTTADFSVTAVDCKAAE